MPAFYLNGKPFYLQQASIPTNSALPEKSRTVFISQRSGARIPFNENYLPPICGQLWQLKLRDIFVYAALELVNKPAQSGTNVARLTEYRWSMEWRENASQLYTFIMDSSPTPLEISFPRSRGSSLSAFEPALVYSNQKRTNEVWFLRRPVSVVQRSRQLCT